MRKIAGLSEVYRLLKINFKNSSWWTVDTLEKPAVHHHETMRYRDVSIFKAAAVRHLGLLKVKFLTALHFRDTFCIIVPNFVETAEISQFLRFSSETQKFTRWPCLIWHNLVRVRDNSVGLIHNVTMKQRAISRSKGIFLPIIVQTRAADISI